MLNIANYLNEAQLFKVLDKYNVFDIGTHCRKVSSFALRIFDSLSPYYELKDEERTLLHYSSILHDIGYFINKENHHRHTKYIILKEPILDNIPKNLRNNLALVASGHGKYIDDCIHSYSYKEKVILIKLISLLRIADSLDHKHNLRVLLKRVEMKDGTLNINIKGDACDLIIKKFKKRSSLFTEIYNIPINMDCS
ncbi:HD domain-containing protein [Clostridium algoriphilum]|uniref:HD domain-containing protein n=1 Tax=Clostridium algoriphilum TaxID=198347 RepID=UPI001CF1E78D|nr:HD domain-containing protein [Clostridium algoriphilum]MCB2295557.1 HD domain-containing protein [Clostridium algoriphilum]